MPRYIFILLLTICSHSLLKGQTLKSLKDLGTLESPPANNNLYLEIGGSFVWIGGINYERVVIRNDKFLMVMRAGLGLDLFHWEGNGVAVPIGTSLNFGNTNYFELGVSITGSARAKKIMAGSDEEKYQWSFKHEIQPLIGYRFQKEKGGFFFRTVIAPVPLPLCQANASKDDCDRHVYSPMLGVSCGLTF